MPPDACGTWAATTAALAWWNEERTAMRVGGVPVPGTAGRQMAAGGLLLAAGATVLDETYDDWLAALEA